MVKFKEQQARSRNKQAFDVFLNRCKEIDPSAEDQLQSKESEANKLNTTSLPDKSDKSIENLNGVELIRRLADITKRRNQLSSSTHSYYPIEALHLTSNCSEKQELESISATLEQYNNNEVDNTREIIQLLYRACENLNFEAIQLVLNSLHGKRSMDRTFTLSIDLDTLRRAIEIVISTLKNQPSLNTNSRNILELLLNQFLDEGLLFTVFNQMFRETSIPENIEVFNLFFYRYVKIVQQKNINPDIIFKKLDFLKSMSHPDRFAAFEKALKEVFEEFQTASIKPVTSSDSTVNRWRL